MARGKDIHDAHAAAVAALGRPLSRRARSRCELCEDTGALKVVEVPPTWEEPDPEAAIMACERCRDLLETRRLPDAAGLRFLEAVMWSEIAPLQVGQIYVGYFKLASRRRCDAFGNIDHVVIVKI